MRAPTHTPVVVGLLASIGLMVGSGCFAHPSAAGGHACCAVEEIPKEMRVVYLSPAGDDTSCLHGRRGTFVPIDMADADVREIEALIRKTDKQPIAKIRRLSREQCPVEVCGEVAVTTGVGCGGALSGHGKDFHFRRVEGAWLLVGVDDWQG